MNVSESIESLFEQGVVQLSVGKNPKGPGFVMEVRQLVENGDDDQTHLVHQLAGPSVVDCLEKAKSKTAHALVVPIAFNRKR